MRHEAGRYDIHTGATPGIFVEGPVAWTRESGCTGQEYADSVLTGRRVRYFQ